MQQDVLDVVVPNRMHLRQAQDEIAKGREQTAAVRASQRMRQVRLSELAGRLDPKQHELHANGAVSSQPEAAEKSQARHHHHSDRGLSTSAHANRQTHHG